MSAAQLPGANGGQPGANGGQPGANGGQPEAAAPSAGALDAAVLPGASPGLPGAAALPGVAAAQQVVARLLAVDGCAWHREQTPQSLVRYLIEESYEVADAIATGQPAAHLAEELGDVLYQVLLHAELAAARGDFDINDVGQRLAAKLRARHPHVFGGLGPKTAQELTAMWEQLKAAAAAGSDTDAADITVAGQEELDEAGRATPQQLFQGIPAALPSLAKAQKVVERQQRAGVPPLAALGELEISDAQTAYGCELYELVTRAVGEGVDVERALREVLARVMHTPQ